MNEIKRLKIYLIIFITLFTLSICLNGIQYLEVQMADKQFHELSDICNELFEDCKETQELQNGVIEAYEKQVIIYEQIINMPRR